MLLKPPLRSEGQIDTCRPGWFLTSSMSGSSGGCGSWWVLTSGESAFSPAPLVKVFSLVFFLSPPYCVLRHIDSLSLSSPWQLAFLGAMVLWGSVQRGSDACLGLSDGGSFSHHLQKRRLWGQQSSLSEAGTRTTWAKVRDNSSETENYVIDFLNFWCCYCGSLHVLSWIFLLENCGRANGVDWVGFHHAEKSTRYWGGVGLMQWHVRVQPWPWMLLRLSNGIPGCVCAVLPCGSRAQKL